MRPFALGLKVTSKQITVGCFMLRPGITCWLRIWDWQFGLFIALNPQVRDLQLCRTGNLDKGRVGSELAHRTREDLRGLGGCP